MTTAAAAADNAATPGSGAAAPAIVRGSVELGSFPGLVTGELADRPTAAQIRIANGTALQAGLDIAAATGKFVEESDGLRIEYAASRVQEGRNVGLQVPHQLRGLVGTGPASNGSRLIQFARNQPAVTLGDIGSGNALSEGCIYRGFRIGYGVSQQGQDQASTIMIGRGFACRYEDLFEDSFMTGPRPCQGMTGLHFHTATGQFTFSNILNNIKIHRAQRNLLRTGAIGTGNVWENVYLGGGTFGSRLPLSGAAVHFANNWAEQALGTIAQLNIEWVEANQFLFMEAVRSASFDSLRFEGCKLIGQSPSLICAVGSVASIRALVFVDVWIDATARGTPSLISVSNDSQVKVDGLEAKWSGNSYNPEAVVSAGTRVVNADPTHNNVDIANACFKGASDQVDLDASLPLATFGATTSVGHYRYRKGQSCSDDSLVSVTDQDHANYGVHRNPTVRYSGALTSPRIVTIHPVMAPSGIASGSLRPDGEIIRIVRDQTATGPHLLVIRDDAGNEIGRLSEPGTEKLLVMKAGRAIGGPT